ncbi:MAG: glycosyltransferase [Gammaproteobacteria bacterium]|nr:glycosyltransferase [Gammaproteobacteria bacterium]
MLKILVLAEHFPNRVQPWLLNWIVESIKRGNSIKIIANDILGDSWQSDVDKYKLLDQTEYYYIASSKDFFKSLLLYFLPFSKYTVRAYKGLVKYLKYGANKKDSLREFARAIAMAPSLVPGDYDVIHSHTIAMSYQFLFLKRTLNIPLITTFHGLPPAGVNMLEKEKMDKVFKEGDLFFVNTEFAKRQLISLSCDEKKIRILPQGINLDEYPFHNKNYPNNGKLIILTVGRFHKDKGHIYAIKAISKLIKEGYELEYRIVGVGPEKNAILQNVADENLTQHVHLLEALNDAELKKQYSEAHIFVLPSIRDRDGVHEETQGVVIQEAQASGLLVVATKTGGIPECVVDGEDAFLVDDRDFEAIYEKIKFLIQSKSNWPLWQKNARRHVEDNFSIHVLGARLLDFYTDTIEAASSNK